MQSGGRRRDGIDQAVVLGMSMWSGMSEGGPAGLSYAAILVRVDPPAAARQQVLDALHSVRFTGWLGPEEQGWVVAVAERGAGTVAAHRRGVLGVAEDLAGRLGVPLVAVRVAGDRQLALSVWADGAEVGRYVSDPSHGLNDETVLPDPLGVEHAEDFAAAVGRPEVGEKLRELLADELASDDEIESERLSRVLRLLGLPDWLVAASSLPRDVPGGPRSGEFTRLGAGVPGIAGRVAGRAAQVARTRRRPPPVVSDPPGADPSADWGLW
jgi:hypothetical protein